MPKRAEDLNLAEYQALIMLYPSLKNQVNRLLVDTYDDFVKILNNDIDEVVKQLERNRELSPKEEDAITVAIIRGLNCMGYNATHDTKNGGHVDITVTKGDFYWFGEAKLYDGPAYLWQGLLQLTTRYTTARNNQNSGGLFIYIFKTNAKKLLSNWKEFIDTKNELKNCSHKDCDTNPPAFYSTFEHEVTGLDFTVRHIPACLYFEPKDKSGVASKAKKKSKSAKPKKNVTS